MTLIELVICINIIILITFLSYPKNIIEKYQLCSFSKQLCSDLRYVKSKNMLGASDVYLQIKNENNNIYYTVNENKKDIKTVNLSKNITLKTNQNKFKFNQNGSIGKGATIHIILNDLTKEITVTPTGGRVLLKEGKYE